MYATYWSTLYAVSPVMNESTTQEAASESRKADCPACKLIGAGGCFAGAWYAMFERARLPSTNRNRHFLGAIAVGEYEITIGNGRQCFLLLCSCSGTGYSQISDLTWLCIRLNFTWTISHWFWHCAQKHWHCVIVVSNASDHTVKRIIPSLAFI